MIKVISAGGNYKLEQDSQLIAAVVTSSNASDPGVLAIGDDSTLVELDSPLTSGGYGMLINFSDVGQKIFLKKGTVLSAGGGGAVTIFLSP